MPNLIYCTAAKVTTRSQAGTETKVSGSASSAQMADYKAELDNYHRDTRAYQQNKAKVFVVILRQCTVAVLSWLENGQGLTDLEVNLDVIGLLEKLGRMALKGYLAGGECLASKDLTGKCSTVGIL
jgi:hypothetical protein